jgi:hypothetical protein
VDLKVFSDPDISPVGTSGFWQLEGRGVLCPAGHIIRIAEVDFEKIKKITKERKL